MSGVQKNGPGLPSDAAQFNVAEPTAGLLGIQEKLAAEIAAAGGEITPDPELAGAIGTTMFDLPGSQDNTITVVLPKESASAGRLAGARCDQEPEKRRRTHVHRHGNRRSICGTR